ncbi:MAG: DNA recombination protein RmuC [Candidatus Berkelbacteria bacterium]|nr:DNA recombination protein RmuC [Candidatus Berkelbacteria bacterium]
MQNMQQIIYYILGAAIILGAILVAGILILRKTIENLRSGQNDSALQMLNQNIQSLQSNFHSKLDVTNKAINERLDNAARVISTLNKELGQMQQIGSQLRNFQDFLKSPKLRGGLGEQGLRNILSQSLPSAHYKMQYKFRNNQVVDAVIKIDAGIIPVDSKSPLEEFNKFLKSESDESKLVNLRDFRRSFKKHVDDISKKYILPDEGTVDFAFMYLPSESVFFEIVNNQPDLLDYATKSKVMPASPSSFLYYLKTIMLGLEGKKITEMSKQILTVLKMIQKENIKFGDGLGVLDSHISNAKKTMERVSSGYTQLSTKIDQVSILEATQTELIEDLTEKE